MTSVQQLVGTERTVFLLQLPLNSCLAQEKKQHHKLTGIQTSRLRDFVHLQHQPELRGCIYHHTSPELTSPLKISMLASAHNHNGTVTSLLADFKSKLRLPMSFCYICCEYIGAWAILARHQSPSSPSITKSMKYIQHFVD